MLIYVLDLGFISATIYRPLNNYCVLKMLCRSLKLSRCIVAELKKNAEINNK